MWNLENNTSDTLAVPHVQYNTVQDQVGPDIYKYINEVTPLLEKYFIKSVNMYDQKIEIRLREMGLNININGVSHNQERE